MFLGTGLDGTCQTNTYTNVRNQFNNSEKPRCSSCPNDYPNSISSDNTSKAQCYATCPERNGYSINTNGKKYCASTDNTSACTGNVSSYYTIIDYTITYNNMTGATWPVIANHPTSYTIESSTFTIGAPSRPGYTFSG